jgi:hypothetical protein
MTSEELQQMFAETARIRDLANPATVPYSDYQVPASNVAPSSFASSLGGLLFGGADSGLSEYLSRDQQKAMQEQAMMNAAMSLLKNSGWSTKRVGLGEALGSAYEAGTAGYQGAQQNAIQQLLIKQKLEEAKRAQAAQEQYQKFIMGQPTEGQAITPDQALAVQGMQAGPTVERASLIGQALPAGVTPSGGAVLTQQQRQLLAALPAEKGIPEALKLMQPQEVTGQPFRASDGKFYIQTKTGGVIPAPVAPADLAAEEYGAPVASMRDGKPVMVQYNKYGQERVVLGAQPYEASPSEIRLLQAANKPITMENIMAIRKSAASQTTNILNAEKKGTELAYENAMKNLNESRAVAQSANDTLVNVSNILPALDSAILGPGADFRTSILRIGKQLNMAGADANQVLANTATVVQGLAQQELTAAAQMRGQGAITEPERAILRRVAGGDQSLTAGELKVGLMAAEKVARARIASHQTLLNKATKAIPQLSNIAPMYEITPFGAQPMNPLQNAIQQEIDKRKAAGGAR